ncbi:MAG: acyl-CoA thioesterase [Pseudomonadales bacterium]
MRERRRLWQKGWPEHPGLRGEAEIVVPFQDADPTGMAWHGNYFRYYDAARVQLLGKLGFGYRDMAAAGQIWPVVETRVRYARSLRFGEQVTVTAQLVEWEFRLRIHYTICTADGLLANEAVTVQVPVASATETIVLGSPSWLLARIDALISAPKG